MAQINCLKCKQPIDAGLDKCPHCSEAVTQFQRTYSARLIDGKYQILDRLGVGGMGEIFKVRHIHLNELRVIKMMRPNVASDEQGLQRFLQEARTSTQIKHKNLAMLYDFAQLEDGSYYMVWEFIDGTNIQKWISVNGPVPPRLSIEMSIQALHGLDHLHSMGLIHRDISPENIMLSQDHHGKLAVKVIDFGIAKQLAEGEGGHGLTQTGMFLGKLKYASPEQAGFLKDGEHLDPRSDLYSFGIVLYEMLAGKAPFQATNPHGYILKHVTEKPQAIKELNPDVKVPAQLESIVMKSLEKNRDARYATAAEFASALEAVRNTIAPDAKYGLGERMITLSGHKTLADLPPIPTGMGTTTGATQAKTISANEATVMDRLGPTGTVAGSQTIGSNEATVMERVGPTGTVAGNRTASGSNDATVMERLNTQAAATVVEQKMGYGEAAPTVMERQISMAPEKKKSNVAMIGSIAAVVVIAIAIGIFAMLRKPAPAPPTGTQAISSGSVIATAPAPTTAPIADGKGQLLLSASPWGEVDKIVDEKGKQISVTEESTPMRLDLPPGAYKVTLSGPNKTQTFDVRINANEQTKLQPDLGSPNLDALEKEVSKQ
jgi:serine/threonine protein kinase